MIFRKRKTLKRDEEERHIPNGKGGSSAITIEMGRRRRRKMERKSTKM